MSPPISTIEYLLVRKFFCIPNFSCIDWGRVNDANLISLGKIIFLTEGIFLANKANFCF